MVRIEDIAKAALAHEALEVRSLVQDLLRAAPDWAAMPRPRSVDEAVMAVSAAFVELFAERSGAQPAAWTRDVGPVPAPIYLLEAARTMPRTRALIEAESPEPLRKRNIFAPKDYAQLV